MKHFYLFAIVLLFSIFCYGQCIESPQLLNARFSKIEFFDDTHGIAFGMGTMIVTDDAGENWQFVELPTANREIETLKDFALLDENTAIISGYGNTLIKTIDKGNTWNFIDVSIEQPVNFTGLSFINNTTGYLTGYTNTTVGGPDGERYNFKTTDGGETWQQVEALAGTEFNFYSYINIKYIDELNGYAWSGAYIYKTQDGGASWTQMQNPTTGVEWDTLLIGDIKFSDNGYMVMSFGDTSAVFYVSEDAGITWSRIEALTWEEGLFISDPVFDIIDNTLCVVASTGNSNYEKSFIKYDLESELFTTSFISNTMLYQNYVRMVNENLGFILDRGGVFWFDDPGRKIFKTVDSGSTWTEEDSFSMFTPNSQNNIRILHNGENVFTMSKQDGTGEFFSNFYVYTSADNGATWQQVAFEASVAGVLLRAEGNYISYLRNTSITNGAEGRSFYESYDLGQTWEVSTFQNPYDAGNNLYTQPEENIIMNGNIYSLVFSYDKGQTWGDPITLPVVENVTFYDIKVKSPQVMYSWGKADGWPAVYDYYLYKTINGGQTWQQVVTIPDNDGQDLGVNAGTTVIGNEIAFISTGGDTYFLVNLLDNTYQEIDFDNVLSGGDQVYVPQEALTFINDDIWLLKSYGDNMLLTYNHGQTWNDVPCVLCGEKVNYNIFTGKLFTYGPSSGAERYETSFATAPRISGPQQVSIEAIETYAATGDESLEWEWVLESGGEIEVSGDGQLVNIEWTEPGTHLLKIKSSNECGNSAYNEFYVTVSVPMLIDNPTENVLMSYPNPFKDKIWIDAEGVEGESSTVQIFALNGTLLYEQTYRTHNIVITGLDLLSSGLYLLTVENVNGKITQKILKE